MKTKQILITLLLFTSSFLYAQTPKFQWVKGGGSGGSATNSGLLESCKWIGTDAHGNIYGMSSIFDVGIHIDTSLHTNGFGFDDFAVFSYHCDGSLRWVRYFGGYTNDEPIGMFADNDGNSFVAGIIPKANNYTDLHYGDSTIHPTASPFPAGPIAKIDSNGHTVWLAFGPIATSTSNSYDYISLKPDNLGNVCLLILSGGVTTWGTFTTSGKGYYIVKFDKSNGNVMGLTKLDFNYKGVSLLGDNLTIDTDNSIYLDCGLGYPDTLLIGNNIITCENDSVQTFTIIKFLPTGSVSWYKPIKCNGLAGQWKSITSKPIIKGSFVYLSGDANNNLNFLGGNVNNPFINYSFIRVPLVICLRKDNGNYVSLNHVYNRTYSDFSAIASTSNGIVVSGSTGAGISGNEIFMYNQNDTLKPGSTYNTAYPFVLGIDTALAHFNWGIATRANSADAKIEALSVDKADNIYAGGIFSDSIYNSFGAGIGSQGGPSDFFIAKIAVTNNCGCALAQTFPQKVSLNNNVLIVKGTATGVTDSLYWYWGDGSNTKYLTQNTNVSHTYSVGGNYSVSLRSYNYCGTKDSTIQITGVGITEQELKYLAAYPNPVSHTLTIENPYQSSMQLSIYSITGKLLYSHQYQNYTTTIDMSPYEAGIYFVEMKLEDGRKAVRKVAKE
ncbi:MAG: T9SS type A sorting domain-containing protein [Bacteroidales bacterium]